MRQVPAFTFTVPLLLNVTGIDCVANALASLVNVPSLTKLLLVVVVPKVIGVLLADVSLTTPPALFVRLTGTEPLPASESCPLRFSVPEFSQRLSVRPTLPFSVVVEPAAVVSNPAPVIVPEDQ